MNTKNAFQNLKRPKGFTIVELLLVLAISGMLMTAVAFAISAYSISYNENEAIFKSVNTARQALARITTDIRKAQTVYVDGETDQQCSLLTTTGSFIRYQFNGAEQKLYMETGGNSYLLCDNVTNMTFIKTKAAGNDFARSVRISMEIVDGNATRKVAAAAVIRRNLD